ncbi:MAG: ABC transporter ATP-binding protein [Negativicutes bacterium]|nr:ABC transporter ATP-binding protein [Negativicutes bacterium]
MSSSDSLLQIVNLTVYYHTLKRAVLAVDRLNLSVKHGEFLGLIGESGSGKSTVAKAVLGLLPAESRLSGSILYKNQSLEMISRTDMEKLRGAEIGFVPQQAVAALNPVRTIGSQLSEVFRLRAGAGKKDAWRMSADMLDCVRIRNVDRVLHAYPHELSGGMCQRVVLAMAIALRPSLLLADEPTTSVDACLRVELLSEISTQQKVGNMGVLFISHDLALVGRYADRLAVMYGGCIVEKDTPEEMFANPKHPYTRLLLGKEGEPELAEQSPALSNGGCAFAQRCRYAVRACYQGQPNWKGDEISGVACFSL